MSVQHPVDAAHAQAFIDHEYYDRGMMKWQGFMLSDHTAKLNQAMHRSKFTRLPRQSQVEIRAIIDRAFQNHRPVVIQTAYLQDDNLIEVTGIIRGIQGHHLFIRTKTGLASFEIEMLRNVRLSR